MKKIIVLGGGAAGWLSALFAKKIFPKNEIKVIESIKIGILGAGEGSTPHLLSFLNFLDINIFDLISKTKGTIKLGINFKDWNGEGTEYFHNFGSHNQFDSFNVENSFTHSCYSKYLINSISKNLNLDDCIYGKILTKNKKVDVENESFSLHFDAHKIAEYLKELALSRGVLYKEGEFKKFNFKEDGDISEVILEDNTNHFCDFIFDCTGFRRLIIGDTYKTKWIDYQKHLPMKKAIPFFLDQEDEITPCTHAVAMRYGWIWKIPLQHRFGSGYIYDSDYIDEEQALTEAENKLNRKLNSPRVISFDAGRFSKVWVNNCIAVGLSAGFTEPLEATSLYITAQQLRFLLHYKDNLFNCEQTKKDNFNKIMGNTNDDILAFLYFHYLTKRSDSPFWKNFRNNTTIPENLKEKLELLKEGIFTPQEFDYEKVFAGFTLNSYLVVGNGLGLIDNTKVKSIKGLNPTIEQYQNMMLNYINKIPSHNNFLKSCDVSYNN
jgi:tryptophan halogenase